MPSSIASNPNGTRTVVIITVFWFLAFVAIIGRCAGRHVKRVALTASDYTIFIAMFFSTGVALTVILAVAKGALGRHISSTTLEEVAFLAKVELAAIVIWGFANTAMKTSVLLLYIELFWTRTFRRVTYAVMTITLALGVVIVLQGFLICRPIEYNWDHTIKGSCANQSSAFLAQAVINLCLDIVIVILPAPILWRLHMAPSKKLGIYLMFCIGFGICALTALRIDAVVNLNQEDFNFSANNFALYNALESLLGIFNGCLPVTRPFLNTIFKTSAFNWSELSLAGEYGWRIFSAPARWLSRTSRSRRTTDGSGDSHTFRTGDSIAATSNMNARNDKTAASLESDEIELTSGVNGLSGSSR